MMSAAALTRAFTLAISLIAGMLCAPAAGAADSVGRVLFAIGDARVANGPALKKNDAIAAGQTIVTGKNGHVHIRFVDEAFVSVRPNSSLTIAQYSYNPNNAAANRVRFELAEGVARLISGKAGQSAKENFRVNTPVAAIGIRGTDFLVQASQATTRVAVQQGAVVVAPFDDACSRSALGPCGGAAARELVGSLTGNYLEIKGSSAPQLIAPSNGRLPFELPRPEEPKVNLGGENTASVPDGMNGSPSLMWGRWSGRAAAPAGYELIGQNDALVLFRSVEAASLPTSGFVSFRLQESQAYGRSSGGYEPATVSGANFSVNFDKMRYATSFRWEFEGQDHVMYSKGGLSDTGRLAPERAASNVALSGALNGNGDEAAYIYFRNISSDLKAYGILRWAR